MLKKSQKATLVAGFFISLLSIIYPPWSSIDGAHIGFGLIFDAGFEEWGWAIKVNTHLLFIENIVIIFTTLSLFLLLGGPRKRKP